MPDVAYPPSATTRKPRLLRIAEKRLGESEYLAGDFYSIADIAFWPHCGTVERFGASPDAYPNIKRWLDLVGERPALKRAGTVIDEVRIGMPPEGNIRRGSRLLCFSSLLISPLPYTRLSRL
jgi:hypothetical protein